MKRKKSTRIPRMCILAVDRRELVEFLECMRRVPQVVRDLEMIVAQMKRKKGIKATTAVDANGAGSITGQPGT